MFSSMMQGPWDWTTFGSTDFSMGLHSGASVLCLIMEVLGAE
jgi:hypothetical protein